MKKIFIAFVAAAGILCSCSEQNTDVMTDEIKLSAEMIPAGPDGVSSKITVTSSGDWRLAGECDWVHPSAVAGKSGQEVTFTVDPNTTENGREAIFKFFTGSSVKALKVTSDKSYILNAISETTVELSKDNHLLAVKLKTNIQDLTQTFSDKGSEWMLFNKRSDAFGFTILSFNVAKNKTYDNRSSVITIAGMGKTCDITVNQAQRDTLVLENDAYSIGLASSTLSINLKSNFDYTVEIPSKYASWIHRTTPAATSPAKSGLLDRIETFTIDRASGMRMGYISLESKTSSFSKTIAIQQVGDTHVYATIPDASFRKWLLDNDYVITVADTKCELTGLGQDLTAMDIPYSDDIWYNGITSLEGITAFTNLASLKYSAENAITTIPLGDLNVTSLRVGYSYAQAPVIVSSSKLTKLWLQQFMYTSSIDVSGCSALVLLDISDCYSLKTLIMKTGQKIKQINDSDAGVEVGGYEKVYK